jgi:hypothetical protein
MHIPYGWVQGSGYNTCTGKYCIICPGGTKKNFNALLPKEIVTRDLGPVVLATVSVVNVNIADIEWGSFTYTPPEL